MKIVLNGKETEVEEAKVLSSLMEDMKLGGPVAAMVNDEVIHREKLGSVRLKEGDRVELFRMMGGG